MLTAMQENKVKDLVDEKVLAKEEFTAFDLTIEVRETEFVMHSDVRDFVHVLMGDYISLNEYSREVHYGQNWSAYKYSPVVSISNNPPSGTSGNGSMTGSKSQISMLDMEDAVGLTFDIQSQGRVSLPSSLLGEHLDEIFVYPNDDEDIVVTTNLMYVENNTKNARRIKRDSNNFRFTLPHRFKNKCTHVEILDVATHDDTNDYSLYIDVY